MNVQTKIEAGDLVTQALANPVALFTDKEKFSDFYTRVKAETEKLVPDVSTAKGRDEIRSMARKVVTTKTAIEKAGKALTEEWRRQTAEVTASRKVMEDQLAALAEEVRKPLTDWEDAEKARNERADALTAHFRSAATVTIEDTAQSVRDRGQHVWRTEVGEDLGDRREGVQAAKDDAVAALKSALARLTREEEERAELERLRAEAAAREEADRAAREQAEAEERAAREAAEAEAARAEAEKREAERLARIEQEAADRAKREAEEAARAEQERKDREHAEQLAAERRRAEEAERAAQVERDRVAAEEAERQRKAKEEADAQAKREADQRHRTKVKTEAKQAIMSCGADEETARKIVLAIQAGEVPHITLRF